MSNRLSAPMYRGRSLGTVLESGPPCSGQASAICRRILSAASIMLGQLHKSTGDAVLSHRTISGSQAAMQTGSRDLQPSKGACRSR